MDDTNLVLGITIYALTDLELDITIFALADLVTT
jgi:hypothetical protein